MIKKKDFIFLLSCDLEMCDKTKWDMIRHDNIREGWGSTSGRKDCGKWKLSLCGFSM